jgi:hypothetical protein
MVCTIHKNGNFGSWWIFFGGGGLLLALTTFVHKLGTADTLW